MFKIENDILIHHTNPNLFSIFDSPCWIRIRELKWIDSSSGVDIGPLIGEWSISNWSSRIHKENHVSEFITLCKRKSRNLN